MDAAAQVGTPVGEKTSSAYAPPELARAKYAICDRMIDGSKRVKYAGGSELARLGSSHEPVSVRQLAVADRSFDIWSLGVILFELCTGRTLFSQDVSTQASRRF